MKIPVLHLEDGIHQLEKSINSESLNFYRRDCYPNQLQVSVELNKFDKSIQCKCQITTDAVFSCGRCLSEIQRPVKIDFDFLLYIDEKGLETDEDNVVNVPADVVEIDITDRIIEQLVLAVPMKIVCSEICKGICSGCGTNLNTGACECGEPPPDPRWEKLKALKINE